MTRLSRALALLAVAGVVTLTGCAAEPAAPPAKVDASDVPVPVEPEPTQDPDFNAHGYTDMTFDDAAVVYYPGTDDIAVSVAVTSIDRNVICTDEFALPPQYGEYIVLNMTITTDANYQTLTGGGSVNFFWQDFFYWSAGDDTKKESGPGSWGCLGEDVEIPDELAPGTTTTAKYFMDVSKDVTSVAWEPNTFAIIDLGGWEWQVQ